MPSQRYSNGPSNGSAIIDGLDGDNPNKGVSGSINEWLAASGLASGGLPVGSATEADSSNKVGVGPPGNELFSLWKGTQAEYDAMTSPRDNNTQFNIIG